MSVQAPTANDTFDPKDGALADEMIDDARQHLEDLAGWRTDHAHTLISGLRAFGLRAMLIPARGLQLSGTFVLLIDRSDPNGHAPYMIGSIDRWSGYEVGEIVTRSIDDDVTVKFEVLGPFGRVAANVIDRDGQLVDLIVESR